MPVGYSLLHIVSHLTLRGVILWWPPPFPAPSPPLSFHRWWEPHSLLEPHLPLQLCEHSHTLARLRFLFLESYTLPHFHLEKSLFNSAGILWRISLLPDCARWEGPQRWMKPGSALRITELSWAKERKHKTCFLSPSTNRCSSASWLESRGVPLLHSLAFQGAWALSCVMTFSQRELNVIRDGERSRWLPCEECVEGQAWGQETGPGGKWQVHRAGQCSDNRHQVWTAECGDWGREEGPSLLIQMDKAITSQTGAYVTQREVSRDNVMV